MCVARRHCLFSVRTYEKIKNYERHQQRQPFSSCGRLVRDANDSATPNFVEGILCTLQSIRFLCVNSFCISFATECGQFPAAFDRRMLCDGGLTQRVFSCRRDLDNHSRLPLFDCFVRKWSFTPSHNNISLPVRTDRKPFFSRIWARRVFFRLHLTERGQNGMVFGIGTLFHFEF